MKSKYLFWSFVGLLLSYFVLNRIDALLQNGDFNFGIIAYELAGNLAASKQIIHEWTARNVIHLASFSLGFDYVFMLFYVSFLALWTASLSSGFHKKLYRVVAGSIISIFIIAGILDGIENYALMSLLGDHPTQILSEIAFYCASLKFGLIGLGIIYNFSVSVGKLISRP